MVRKTTVMILSISLVVLTSVGVWQFWLNDSDDSNSDISGITNESKSSPKLDNNIDFENTLDHDISSQATNDADADDTNNSSSEDTQEIVCTNYSEDELAIFEQQRMEYFEELSAREPASLTDDEKIATALFTNHLDSKKRLNALFATEQYATNALVALEILNQCSNKEGQKLCSNDLVDSITKVHRDDSEIWLYATHYFVATEQFELANDAIEKATQASYATSKLSETIRFYNQTLSNAHSGSVGELSSNTLTGFGIYAAYSLPAYSPIIDWCSKSVNDTQIAQACLKLGLHWEKRGIVLIDNMIGLAIQEIVYKSENNEDMVKITKQKKADLNSFLGSIDEESTHLLTSNESLLNSYLEYYATKGEIGALIGIESDITEFKETSSYAECYGQN